MHRIGSTLPEEKATDTAGRRLNFLMAYLSHSEVLGQSPELAECMTTYNLTIDRTLAETAELVLW